MSSTVCLALLRLMQKLFAPMEADLRDLQKKKKRNLNVPAENCCPTVCVFESVFNMFAWEQLSLTRLHSCCISSSSLALLLMLCLLLLRVCLRLHSKADAWKKN